MLVTSAVEWLRPVKSNIVNDTEINGAYLDSRLVKPGSLFFCVKGENTDGNDYAQQALDKGAAAVIMDNEEKYNKVSGSKILVKDTIEAMKSFGAERFKLYSGRKIAVTGSFGKTGMKEMLKNIFSENETVYATEGNKNNLLGVSLTGCGIDDNASTIIIELGSNNMGEISELSKLVKPDICVVTNAGHAHIGRFGTLERVIFEKMSIADGLSENGILIIPQKLKPFVPKGSFKYYTFGEAESAGIYMTEHRYEGEKIVFKTNIGSEEFVYNHPYLHTAYNSLAGIMAAELCGISRDKIIKGVSKYKPVKGHGSVEYVGDITIIDDTYNAGFESIIKSAESLAAMDSENKYAVYGEMGEIEGYEKELYNEITQLAYTYKDINFYLCGESYKEAKDLDNRKIFVDKESCIRAVKEIKKGIILVKAARSRKFEDIVSAIKGA